MICICNKKGESNLNPKEEECREIPQITAASVHSLPFKLLCICHGLPYTVCFNANFKQKQFVLGFVDI